MCADCGCSCDHVSPAIAVAVATQKLWRTPLLPSQTLVVESEHDSCYGVSGETKWLSRLPLHEHEIAKCLPDGMGPIHQGHQRAALGSGEAQYSANGYGVDLLLFRIEGRRFTTSVFTPIN